MKYRREIDGLRALAVVPVVLFHAGSPIFPGGFVGVDVFFVISGYLITAIILADLKNNRFSILEFYERRARRILPALFFVAFVCFPVAWIYLLPDDMQAFTKSLIAVSLFISNLLFWHESGYFDTANELKPLLHTWSLAVEEQYYLIFPLILMFVWRFRRHSLFIILAVIAVASLCLAHWATLSYPHAAFYLLPTRAWELMLGGLVAVHHSGAAGVRPKRILVEIGSGLGIIFILYAMIFYNREILLPGFHALVPVIGTALVILLSDKDSIVGKLLGLQVLVGIGLISYGAYLWHYPLFAFARYICQKSPEAWVFFWLAVLTFAIAYVSRRFIEIPFRSKEKFSRKQIFNYSLVGILCMGALGLSGQISQGFIGRFELRKQSDDREQNFYELLDQRYYDCEPAAIARAALKWQGHLRCKQSKPGPAQFVLLGDSHAEHLFVGLAEGLPEANVVFYILSGNPYVSNRGFDSIFQELLGNEMDQTILLAMDYIGRVNGPEELFREFTATVDKLQAADKKVVLLGDVPRYVVKPFACLLAKHNDACFLSKLEADSQRDVYRPTLERLSRVENIPYIDLYESLCDANGCGMFRGKVVFYRDRDHLNVAGSRIVGAHIANRLKE